ncbi:NAD(P)/FAD-dependent oxidoreductase [Tenacibaculum finnmarkense genomovar finnmarkense]|uniref:FAD-dependent oxidoreductase n=1 Tax=Tenacibaculum finnmarkense genomovar finnmarkense TaxID=1458503 RepID=A0AAP1RCW5_9FLAO|nr:FAD-dependent oxidoreductase [Tenacibaculum finnmarkense]MCD8451195.1 FAD-dependent oxidoreductase [Tenacibaculum dicentrarchi]MBE7645131.1 FAD-dependent oxidoreductase [Tenacibaculum finnmarkense genomovar ulcerans]MBE7651676.1 FAD-dependent oxidoreductase [Tenacibaculum finnmarkense genomovar finnmarkense]MBE7659521.1 FAD-dependent oxidoreductase [Tenacibaculum finnmarkense genomovar finnmarkense]MBE7687059.1 FAD-dependent oxidoreductase [Tenacibaculum finnmarkense genomovar ulcerans]
MIFDVLVIGGGVSGMQCALVLGSAHKKAYAKDKKIGILLHQKASHLQDALFNNVLGLPEGKLGKDILIEGKAQLKAQYPNVIQIENEKVLAVLDDENGYKISTNKQEYLSKKVVIALNYSKPFEIAGLEQYVERHIRANVMKDRIQLRNFNHLIKQGLYVCGTLAGWRSQFAIAAGSGASVATDILTVWNDHTPTKVHDKII